MSKPPRVYIDAGVFIDLAKHKAELLVDDEAKRNVWFTQQLLEASRKRDVFVVTSILTVAECTHLKDSKPIPSEDIKRFYDGLLCSGKGGVTLTQSTFTIVERARNLRWIHGVYLSGTDSIHVASAMDRGCTEMLTTDGKILGSATKLAELGLKVCKPFDTETLPSAYRQMTMDSSLKSAASSGVAS